jgi:hypothetical protein
MRPLSRVLGLMLVVGQASTVCADEVDLTGSWQVNMDCGFYATATSYLNLDTDVVTGAVTALEPDGCGTVQFPGSIEPITSCAVVSGSDQGSVAGTIFDLPAVGFRRTEAVFSPFFYPLIFCTVDRLRVDSRFDATVFTDGAGNAVRLQGAVTNENLEFVAPGGAVCYSLSSSPECLFEARRNDVAVGTNVAVEPRSGTTVRFDTVSAPGTVSVTPLTAPDGNVPAGFRVYAPDADVPIFYDIHTTATVSGPIESCFAYPDANDDGVVDGTLPYVFEDALRILHDEDGDFVDRTSVLDTAANVICAETTTLSQVTVGASDENVPWEDHPLAAAKLVVKRSSSGAEKVVFVSKDPDVFFPEPGTLSDPRAAGATLELFAHGENAVDATALDPRDWRLDSNDKYSYRKFYSGTGTGLLKRGRVLKIKLRDIGLDLALAAPQGSMAVRLTTGLVRHCAYFEAGDARRDLPGRFVAKRRDTQLTDCSTTALTP